MKRIFKFIHDIYLEVFGNPKIEPISHGHIYRILELDEIVGAIDDEASLMSVAVWSDPEGGCEHRYIPRAPISKHAKDMSHVSATHLDFICKKCGHSLCQLIDPSAKDYANVMLDMTEK